ncbi:hypothetical protein NN561_015736 [Cricetulus griseus]
MGGPPARNSRCSAPGEQLERWATLTQMRTALAPDCRHLGSSHPEESSHLGGRRSLSLSSPLPGHLPPDPGRATWERPPGAQASPPPPPAPLHFPWSPALQSDLLRNPGPGFGDAKSASATGALLPAGPALPPPPPCTGA